MSILVYELNLKTEWVDLIILVKMIMSSTAFSAFLFISQFSVFSFNCQFLVTVPSIWSSFFYHQLVYPYRSTSNLHIFYTNDFQNTHHNTPHYTTLYHIGKKSSHASASAHLATSKVYSQQESVILLWAGHHLDKSKDRPMNKMQIQLGEKLIQCYLFSFLFAANFHVSVNLQ